MLVILQKVVKKRDSTARNLYQLNANEVPLTLHRWSLQNDAKLLKMNYSSSKFIYLGYYSKREKVYIRIFKKNPPAVAS